MQIVKRKWILHFYFNFNMSDIRLLLKAFSMELSITLCSLMHFNSKQIYIITNYFLGFPDFAVRGLVVVVV